MSEKKSENRRSSKTEAVMKLLTGSNIAVNPMLDNEFKQSVIESRSASEQRLEAKRIDEENKAAKSKARAEKTESLKKMYTGAAEICISSELISELLPQVMKRFNCCMCDICFAQAMADALDMIPILSVRIHNEADLKRADALKERSRSETMSLLVKLAIARRSLPRHDK